MACGRAFPGSGRARRACWPTKSCSKSPVVYKPQPGKAIATKYLAAALKVLGGEFRYVEEWVNPQSAVLEFVATLDGVAVNGVDIFGWDANDRIIRFKVMVRPLKGMEALRAKMAAELGFPVEGGVG